MSGSPDELKIQFRAFLQGGRVLIVDPSPMYRTALAALMKSMGADGADLLVAPSYRGAQIELNHHSDVKVVICEHDLEDGHNGIRLMKEFRNRFPASNAILVLFAATNEPSDVAKAAEAEIDLFVTKPYINERVKNHIMLHALSRLNPGEHFGEMKITRVDLNQGNIRSALDHFQSARAESRKLNSGDWLITTDRDLATDVESPGFSVENRHKYRFTVDLFEYLKRQNREREAYQVISRIARYYLQTPDRFRELVRLSLAHGYYDDVEKYFALFQRREKKNREIGRSLWAGLTVSAKYQMEQKNRERAIELFEKSIIAAGVQYPLIKRTVLTLIDYQLLPLAKEIIRRSFYKPDQENDRKAFDFMILDRECDHHVMIPMGWRLLDEGVHDFAVYRILIRRLLERGKTDPAENLVYNGAKRWPEHREELLAMLPSGAPETTPSRTDVSKPAA